MSFGQRCAHHAAQTPDRTAIIVVDAGSREASIDYRRLDIGVNRLAWLLRREGVGVQSLIVIALPVGIEHFATALAAWRLGACVLPLNPDTHPTERSRVVALARTWRRVTLVGEWVVSGIDTVRLGSLEDLAHIPADLIENAIPLPGRAIVSGGSTGAPKIIVDPKPWAHVPGRWGALGLTGLRAAQRQLVAGRPYHNVGFTCGHVGLFEGHTLIVPARFDAAQAIELVQRHEVQFASFLPIMMQRIAKLNPECPFTSIEGMYHAGGACPDWVKRAWLKLVRPERLWELYGSTEESGITAVSGVDWLQRPGTVGLPYHSDILISGEDREIAAAGEIGEIFMRNSKVPGAVLGEHWPQDPSFMYIGAPHPETLDGGYYSVGDLGWLDDDGYLFLSDRRLDMIKSGGINVYPAEIEAALSSHAEIQDVVVIGLPDPEWGQRVHAIIQPTAWPPGLTAAELDAFCRDRLTSYKAPKSYELLQSLPREASGKIRRSALRQERLTGHFPGIDPAQLRGARRTSHNGTET